MPIAGDDKRLGDSTRTLERSSRTPVGKRIRFALGLVTALFLLPYAAFQAATYLPPQSSPFTAVRYNATPEQLAMKRRNPWIESFLSDLMTNRTPCNGTDVTAFVQTSPLEQWFWLLRPNSFECDLVCDLPGARFFYCQAFLIGSDGRLSKMLDVVPGDKMRIRVTEPGRQDRLFVIAGVCWPEGTKTDELRNHLKLEKPGDIK